MGRDKALVEVEGRALAVRVARAAAEAGAAQVVAVGGDTAALSDRGLVAIGDAWPGEGPLGGIVTALDAADHEIGFVAACDLVDPDAVAIAATVAALVGDPDADLAVPVTGDGRHQWLHAAWRRRVRGPLRTSFVGGARAVHRAVGDAGLTVRPVVGPDDRVLADADRPEDLPGEGGRA